MIHKTLIFLIMFITFLPVFVFAQNVKITQIDSSELLPYSNIDCYVSITDKFGEPMTNANYSLFRAWHEKSRGMFSAKILDITKNGAPSTKTTFLLILDNSGSMYKPLSNDKKETKLYHAKRAVREFLGNISSTGNRVGLAVFNTRYSLLVEPGKNIEPVVEALERIKKPDKKNAFTELYYAIYKSTFIISRYRGRKAIILLSDGQNYPYFEKSGKPNPEIGKKLYTPKDALISLQKEGITLYSINFSRKKDPALSSISTGSGGTIYDAFNSTQLLNIYKRIQDRIAKEYRITLKAPLVFLERPKVEIQYKNSIDTKTYYTPSLMGPPTKSPFLFSLIAFVFAISLWFLLVLIRFEKPAKQAEISMLKRGSLKPMQRTIVLNSPRTVIGASPNADFTIAQNSKIKESYAEIIQDKKTGKFTLVSNKEINVNNKPTKKRKLKPGDVINVEGITIVFDAPEE